MIEIVSKNGKFGIKKEKTIHKYDDCYLQPEIESETDVIRVKFNSKWGVVDKDDNIIVNFKYDNLISISKYSLKYCFNKNGVWGVLYNGKETIINNFNNKQVINFTDEIVYFNEFTYDTKLMIKYSGKLDLSYIELLRKRFDVSKYKGFMFRVIFNVGI